MTTQRKSGLMNKSACFAKKLSTLTSSWITVKPIKLKGSISGIIPRVTLSFQKMSRGKCSNLNHSLPRRSKCKTLSRSWRVPLATCPSTRMMKQNRIANLQKLSKARVPKNKLHSRLRFTSLRLRSRKLRRSPSHLHDTQSWVHFLLRTLKSIASK